MTILKKNRYIYEYFMITIGTILAALAINMAYEPVSLVTGGVSGLAIVIKHISERYLSVGIPIWMTTLILNAPLFVVAVIVKGKSFIAKSLYATVVLTFALYLSQDFPPVTTDLFLATVLGAVISGLAFGMVFGVESTTGGSDLAAAIVQNYLKYYSIAKILFAIDALIVITGAFVFGPEKALYSIIAIYISAKITDAILEGTKFAKAAFIISCEYEKIAEAIMSTMDRGVTGVGIQGMYTKKESQMLICAVHKKQIVILKDIIRDVDPKAFVMVADVREVVGEGFIEYK
ncbi:MAG: YitT family protein [Clostridiales bacterium]|jgi:uncharacterized membrane-anchored protein YitT (DUF2179 family)|nr:YitT family protein [Clostridiales bacterium]